MIKVEHIPREDEETVNEAIEQMAGSPTQPEPDRTTYTESCTVQELVKEKMTNFKKFIEQTWPETHERFGAWKMLDLTSDEPMRLIDAMEPYLMPLEPYLAQKLEDLRMTDPDIKAIPAQYALPQLAHGNLVPAEALASVEQWIKVVRYALFACYVITCIRDDNANQSAIKV